MVRRNGCKPIYNSIKVDSFLLSVTLWLRLVGAVGSGWLADRIGRKTPLMISILWYSICNFIAGFSPTFLFLFLFRALLGIGMGAEWPAGAALAMESWPARSRGFMSGMLQGSWSLGFLLASLIYGLAFIAIGWRGLLMIGLLPALPSSMCGSSSRSRRSGRKTAGASAPRDARCTFRFSTSSSPACSATP